MTSQARATANAANAQPSTGPRTAEGKARSSQNGRQHGLTARDLVLAAQDRPEFEAFQAAFYGVMQSSGLLQQTLFDPLLHAGWNLRRIRRLEAQLNRT